MEEILALQQQLADAQASGSAARLSERNCIELVMKLQSLSLVDLIFTRSGREYLTPAQLRKEIADEVEIRGGRVNLIDLPDALNVDLSHIQAAIPDVLAAAPVPTRLVNGEVVSDDYLATLAADIDAALTASDSGIDDVGAIAQRTNLPVAVVRACIAAHLGSAIHATLDDHSGVLRSHASRVRAEAAARGALRACAAPAPLADLARAAAAPSPLVADVAAAMLAAGRLRGRVDGGGAAARWVPRVFEDAAAAGAAAKFGAAGFVALAELRALAVADTAAFAAALPGAVTVSGLVVGPALLEGVESSALEAIASGTWLDVAAALPPDFPEDNVADVVSLLDHLGSKPKEAPASSKGGKGSSKRKASFGKAAAAARAAAASEHDAGAGARDGRGRVPAKLDAMIYCDRYLLSKPLLERCWSCVCRDASERAKTRATKVRDAMAVAGGNAPPPVAAAPVPDADNDDAAPKKGKARRRKAKPSAAETQTVSDGPLVPVDVPSPADLCAILGENGELVELLAADYLGNAPKDGEGALLETIATEGLASVCGASIAQVYETTAAAAVADMEKEQQTARLALERSIVSGLEDAELFSLTAATMRMVSDTAVDECRAHVLATTCIQTTLSVSEFVASTVGTPRSSSAGLAGIRDINARLPPDVVAKMRPVVAAVAGKKATNVGDFLLAYDAAASALDLPPRRPLDKKRERASNAAHAAAAAATLAAACGDASTPGGVPVVDALAAAAALLHARRTGGAVVSLPHPLVPAACVALEQVADRPAGAGEALARLREAVTARLRGAADGASPVVDGELVAAVEAVRTLVVL